MALKSTHAELVACEKERDALKTQLNSKISLVEDLQSKLTLVNKEKKKKTENGK